MRITSGIKHILRNQIAIGQAVTIIIAAGLLPFAYSETTISNRLNVVTPQTTNPLIVQGAAEENRMIKANNLDTYFSIKVTTENQKRYDRDQDGYLTGKELLMYLRHYAR